MAITKVSRNLLNTGVSDSSDATAITIDSDENIGFNTTGIAAGSTSSASNSTATPKKIVINNDYSNGATDASLKLYLYNSGSVRQGFTSGSNYDLQYHNSGHATGRHAFYVGNTESVRIDANGIKFNGDSAAANALNDYEEGSWTPTNADSGETANMGGDSARYTKIGNMVSLRFDITNTSGNHANLIGGLPYTVKTAAHGGIFIVYNNLSSGTSEYTTGYCNAGSTYIRLTVAGGVNSWQLNNGYRIIGFGVYETDS